MDKIKDFECFPIEANKQAGNLQQFSNIFGQSVSSKNDILNIKEEWADILLTHCRFNEAAKKTTSHVASHKKDNVLRSSSYRKTIYTVMGE